jgi:hypothetical protein
VKIEDQGDNILFNILKLNKIFNLGMQGGEKMETGCRGARGLDPPLRAAGAFASNFQNKAC